MAAIFWKNVYLVGRYRFISFYKAIEIQTAAVRSGCLRQPEVSLSAGAAPPLTITATSL